MREVRERLRALLKPGVEALGFELVDVELAGNSGHPTLRIYIDGEGGITVDDCASVSRQLSSILDVEDPLPGSYNLEVSSPGLDRPLVTVADFSKRLGETVKVKMALALEGRRNFAGKLLSVNDLGITVEVDGQAFSLAFDAIDRARLVPKFK
jgi:ribosome maturation factor RimP